VTYSYDALGNKTSMNTADGAQTTAYTYDGRGRLIKLTDPMGKFETYTYDNNNNLLTKTDRKNTVITNTYDALSRLLSVSATTSGAAAVENMAFLYYKTGARKQEKNESLTTDFVYDDAGRVTQQTEVTNTVTIIQGERLPALTIIKTQSYDVRDNRVSLGITRNGVAALS
jgi:YD repeat-containing protein